MPTRKQQTQRVFLVVVDQTPELKVALRFACRRARHSGGRVAMLYVTEPAEASEWVGVGELMREERRQEAEARLQELSSLVQELSGEMPMLHVREGDAREELLRRSRLTGGARAVDVTVTRLRPKIEDDPRNPRHLQTVRGAGYVLRAE